MNLNNNYPDFAAIEQHIHRARVERAVVISQGIVAFVGGTVRGLRRVYKAICAGIARRGAPLPHGLAKY